MEDRLIVQHRPTLMRLLSYLLVYLGIIDDSNDMEGAAGRAFRAMAEPSTVSRRTHRLIQNLLLPVEGATRRLIMSLAHSLPNPQLHGADLKPEPKRTFPKRVPVWKTYTPGVMVPRHIFGAPVKPEPKPPVRPPRFALLDTMKRFNRKRYVKRVSVPRIRSLNDDVPWSPPPPVRLPQTPYDRLSDRPLLRRVVALAYALNELPKQAQRFAKWRARRDAGLTRRFSPLRAGYPPGWPPRRLPKDKYREEHRLLIELDLWAINPPPPRWDSS